MYKCIYKFFLYFVKRIAPTFGAINLENISAPRCIKNENNILPEPFIKGIADAGAEAMIKRVNK